MSNHFFQENYLFFFSSRRNLSVFKKHGFTPNSETPKFSNMLKCIFKIKENNEEYQ